MKQIKELQIKAEDLRKKVRTYCADQTHETPVYPNQKDNWDRIKEKWLSVYE